MNGNNQLVGKSCVGTKTLHQQIEILFWALGCNWPRIQHSLTIAWLEASVFNKVHSTTILTVLTESVLSQNLGKCIHYLVIHTDGKDLDKTKLLMFSKMMVTNIDVFCSRSVIGLNQLYLNCSQIPCNMQKVRCK